MPRSMSSLWWRDSNKTASGNLGTVHPAYYEVWIRVAECPSRVFFKAQAVGTIFEMNDKADCVAIAKAADTSAS